MKKSIIFYLLLTFLSTRIVAQDSTLIGRFSVGLLGSFSTTNISEEVSKGGFALQFRYFPVANSAFSLTYQNLRTSIARFERVSKCTNSNLGFGYEQHVPFNKFSPYAGLEVGLNITKTRSSLRHLPSNNQYFQNNLPNLLFKPKIGLLYNINSNILVHFEGSYNWIIATDRDNNNPLFDDVGTAIYFGRKVPTIAIGMHYKFNE
jgi:opacity protein-like surface antigen